MDAPSQRVSLGYKPNKCQTRSTKQAWVNAHEARSYMGLAQVCRTSRLEFLPLYLESINVRISPFCMGQYLSAFGLDEKTQAMGEAFTVFKHAAVSDHVLELLPILESLANSDIELKWGIFDEVKMNVIKHLTIFTSITFVAVITRPSHGSRSVLLYGETSSPDWALQGI